jgi:hypothetical protein
MFRLATILTLSLLTSSCLLGQQNGLNQYKIYRTLIQTEIPNKTKSIVVVSKLKTDSTSISWVRAAIDSQDPQDWEQLRFLTRDENDNPVRAIDTATQKLIRDFCRDRPDESQLNDQFVIPKVKVFLVSSFPIHTGSENEWKKFYKEYPGSAGVFEFSNIWYSEDGNEAIFYHTHSRRGLSAHGALTILKKNANGEWKIKYQVNLWQA